MYLADNKALEIEGKGDVCIKTTSGNQCILKDVRYIPGIKKNLISVGQLDSTGYAVEFGKGSWKIVKGAMVVARGTKSGNFGKVYLADNKALEIERKGDVCIKTTSGNQWTLEDVRYIPWIKKNLIFLGKLIARVMQQSLGKVRGRS